MGYTVLVYVCLAVPLAVIAVTLVLRDLGHFGRAHGRQPRRAGAQEGGAKLRRFPSLYDEPPARSLTGRIDQSFGRLILQTGIDASPIPAFLVLVLSGLSVGGAAVVWSDNLLPGVAGMLAGMAAGLMYFMYRRSRRLKTMREQLPDVMDAIGRAVRAGESLDQALASVEAAAAGPLGMEFQRCARQLEMGLSVPAAMRSLAQRVPLTELRIFSTALNVQRRTGGSLAVTLDRLAGVIRDRLSYQRQFLAATGASRMATILIALAGPLVFTYMWIWQPQYVGQFFALPGGWVLLAAAVVLQVVGLAWIYGLLRNDY